MPLVFSGNKLNGMIAAAFTALLFTLAAGSGLAADKGQVVFHADTFGPDGSGWKNRNLLESSPAAFSVGTTPSLGGPGVLEIYGNSLTGANGYWYTEIPTVTPGAYYRLEAASRTLGVPYPRRQTSARLDWLDSSGKRLVQPEYAWQWEQDGDWNRVSGIINAPEGAVTARIELFLSHCPQGRVWWDDISLSEIPEPPTRMVKVGAANCRPDGAATNMGMAEQFFGVVNEAGRQGCDIVLLGETITMPARGDVPALEKAVSVPGPVTEKFSELARKWKMYIIVGLLENENGSLYNTAVLIGRDGSIAGKYRKVFLPLEDIECGIIPGDSYPVFETDFGKIGIMICYDIQFVDPGRALSAQGAEIIFVPNWGNVLPAGVRAMENHVWLASSGYDTPTDIYDPFGKRIAWADERPSVAVAGIDLNARYRDRWMRARHDHFRAELRPDIQVPALGDGVAK
jgi:predicted amidohydrolase